ncbi:DUF2535 family protein [Mesobacillus foraminis]|uniref:Uncharacterized protein DUF2535 n=1 Tax=Mesobacillus foraminis TaxID=279826 RepID=A0A4R2AYN8_9BACI|nr:DUF2535 family protein [Mesobacillus foraminis]TCN18953.1 uncharacterized protein DUF2535 [Mesobacillus foraminis]
MIYKSLEFKNSVGQKVKIVDIPVLDKESNYHFFIQARLQVLITSLSKEKKSGQCSFRDYLKGVLKWPEYEQFYNSFRIRKNA